MNPLKRYIQFLLDAANIRLPATSQAVLGRFVVIITETIEYQITSVPAADQKEGRRKIARLAAAAAIAFERFLRQTLPSHSNDTFAPLAAALIRFIMENVACAPRPSDARWEECLESLLLEIENPIAGKAVQQTYRQILKVYRLRRLWVVCVTFPVLLL